MNLAFLQTVWVAGLIAADSAGLLHPGDRCIAGDRAAVMENVGARGNRGKGGRCQAQDGERGEEHLFHRNSPSLVGRNVRL
jgi:hypothetical protein